MGPQNSRRVLVVFAHPALERSRVNRRLVDAVGDLDAVTVRDLYELYPEFDVAARVEQRAIEAHDVVVLQHPLYWYSMPALLKQWLDIVLEHGWAFGHDATALHGKGLVEAVTTGGGAGMYTPQGLHGATLGEMLLPVEKTARLCGMTWHEPYAVHQAHRLSDAALDAEAERYRSFVLALAAGDEAAAAAARDPTGAVSADAITADPGVPTAEVPRA